MSKGLKIPALVVLAARETVSQREILDELKITRQSLAKWRLLHGFPEPSEKDWRFNFYRTAEVAEFCRSAGARVQIV